MRYLVILLCTLSVPALAQEIGQTPPPPPPIVNAPADVPTATPPPPADQAPTPPPPGSNPPMGYTPGGTSGYQQYYGAPYGQPPPKPSGPELGLIFTEGAFGILTAGAEVLLPYLLLSALGGSGGVGFSSSLENILLLGILIAEPLAISQTIIGIANGSRYYFSESWPAMLAGLGAEAAVVGIYYLLTQGNAAFGSDAMNILMVTSVVLVPIVEIAVLNLTKGPKAKMFGALNFSHEGGWTASLPIPSPLVASTPQGLSLGMMVPVLSGRF